MELFNAAVGLSPVERPSFVRRACGADVDLMDEVASLLTWDAPTHPGDSSSEDGRADEDVGRGQIPGRIGPYDVADQLGAGGMAIVYRARQAHPERFVALKVLRTGGADSLSSQRFKREIDVLARLRHPGIAQIYDAGTANDGGAVVSYFAMELVEGEPLTTFADAQFLDRNQRLQLLIRVCEAVEYAHQRGVIHRDLKPANILVEKADGAGRPRVLDFGIARLLEPHEAGSAFVTREHRIVGTLAYMSPEQLNGDHAIDTRADVFALGAVGYELLAGRTPLDVSCLSMISAIGRIRSQTPPPLGQLQPVCRGDLSLIFDKALAKDPQERYASVAAFAEDLRAFLENRPIQARALGRLYLFRKFSQRNPLTVALVGLSLITLIAGTVGTSLGLLAARRANLELQDQLAQTTDSARFLVREVVARLDAVAGTAEVRRAMLERLLAQIEDLRRRDPRNLNLMEDHAVVFTCISDVLFPTDRLNEALDLRHKALDLYRELADLDPQSPARKAAVSIALVKEGDVHKALTQWDLAREHYERAYAIDQELVASEPDSIWFLDDLAWSHDRLGQLAMILGELDEAERHFRSRLAINHRLLELAPDRHATRHGIVSINTLLAELAQRRGDEDSRESHLRAAYAAAERLAAELPHHRLYVEVLCHASRDLGTFLAGSQNAADAKPYLDRAVQLAARLHALDPGDVHTLNVYADTLLYRGQMFLAQGDRALADADSQMARQLSAGVQDGSTKGQQSPAASRTRSAP